MPNPTRTTVSQIHQIKTDLLMLRRALWPHREALNHLLRDPNPLLGPETRIYLRDVYDRLARVSDLLEPGTHSGAKLEYLVMDLTDVKVMSVKWDKEEFVVKETVLLQFVTAKTK